MPLPLPTANWARFVGMRTRAEFANSQTEQQQWREAFSALLASVTAMAFPKHFATPLQRSKSLPKRSPSLRLSPSPGCFRNTPPLAQKKHLLRLQSGSLPDLPLARHPQDFPSSANSPPCPRIATGPNNSTEQEETLGLSRGPRKAKWRLARSRRIQQL